MPLAAYGSRAELTALGSPELGPDREADDRRNASVSPPKLQELRQSGRSEASDSAGQAQDRPVVAF